MSALLEEERWNPFSVWEHASGSVPSSGTCHFAMLFCGLLKYMPIN